MTYGGFILLDEDGYDRTAQRVQQELERIRLGHQDMTGVLRGMLGQGYTIDEMALMFKKVGSLHEFIRHAVQHEGYTLFNTAEDRVLARPLRSSYAAYYWFLTTPYGYRLELMVSGGGSPLHDRAVSWLVDSGYVHMHASFKVADEEQYAVINGTLANAGYECVQRCDSTYGRFGYWQGPEGDEGLRVQPPDWYLKPRLNVRDAGLTQAEQQAETRAAGE